MITNASQVVYEFFSKRRSRNLSGNKWMNFPKDISPLRIFYVENNILIRKMLILNIIPWKRHHLLTLFKRRKEGGKKPSNFCIPIHHFLYSAQVSWAGPLCVCLELTADSATVLLPSSQSRWPPGLCQGLSGSRTGSSMLWAGVLQAVPLTQRPSNTCSRKGWGQSPTECQCSLHCGKNPLAGTSMFHTQTSTGKKTSHP